jgi:hypothetical protein
MEPGQFSQRLDARGLIPGRGKKILVGTVSRPALVSTHADVQRFQGLLPRQYSGWYVKLTTQLILLPKVNLCMYVWICTSTPPYVMMIWCLVKHRGNFTVFTPDATKGNAIQSKENSKSSFSRCFLVLEVLYTVVDGYKPKQIIFS